MKHPPICLLVTYDVGSMSSLSALLLFGWAAIQYVRLALLIKMGPRVTLESGQCDQYLTIDVTNLAISASIEIDRIGYEVPFPLLTLFSCAHWRVLQAASF